MVCYRKLFRRIESLLEQRYNITIKDDDYKDIEPELISQLEEMLQIKIDTHEAIEKALEQLKRLYPNKFTMLEDWLFRQLRLKRDVLRKKVTTETKKDQNDDNKDDKDSGGGSGGIQDNRKKKKKDLEYIYF